MILPDPRPLTPDPCSAPSPCSPTDAPAGSAAKLEALAARRAAGLPLWHPDDSQAIVPPPCEPDARNKIREPRRAPGVADPEA